MNRREFIAGAAAVAGVAGCRSVCREKGRILFGACSSPENAKLLASVGYDFFESTVASALGPDKDAEWWKQRKDMLLSLPLPMRSCNGFIPGTFRLTGPKADFAPALDYAETALRRAEEIGVKTVAFGSGGARSVPGDACGAREQAPQPERGVEQYTEFCRLLCDRVKDLRTATVVVEPLRPNETNVINYVWQGAQVCGDVDSPRLRLLADIFHMMMGRESAESIVRAGGLLKHCHVASYGTRQFPGSDPETVARLVPYFDALRAIGYAGGVSCECSWGEKGDYAKNLEIALKTLRSL